MVSALACDTSDKHYAARPQEIHKASRSGGHPGFHRNEDSFVHPCLERPFQFFFKKIVGERVLADELLVFSDLLTELL